MLITALFAIVYTIVAADMSFVLILMSAVSLRLKDTADRLCIYLFIVLCNKYEIIWENSSYSIFIW